MNESVFFLPVIASYQRFESVHSTLSDVPERIQHQHK